MKIYIKRSRVGREQVEFTIEEAIKEIKEILKEWRAGMGAGKMTIRMEP